MSEQDKGVYIEDREPVYILSDMRDELDRIASEIDFALSGFIEREYEDNRPQQKEIIEMLTPTYFFNKTRSVLEIAEKKYEEWKNEMWRRKMHKKYLD